MSNSEDTVRKTGLPPMTDAGRQAVAGMSAQATSNNGSNVIESKQYNILNNYRSSNYMFTFSALRKTQVNDPAKYRNSELTLVILKSGGKGNSGISTDITPVQRTYTPPPTSATSKDGNVKSKPAQTVSSATTWTDYSGGALVGGFNKESPGRFDMFIENVEIESVMGFSQTSSVSQATKISFEVFEPYSISGFIEALQVSAIAAGYPSYQGASFLLKIDFIGYPDTADFTKAEIVPKSSRYFPILITGLEVSVDERGTKYKVSATPFNEAGFGQPSQLKKAIKFSGGGNNKVSELLNGFMKSLNDQIIEADNEAKKKKLPLDEHDTYRVSFQKWVDGVGFTGAYNDISESQVVDILKDNAIYGFPDSAKAEKPNNYKYADGSGNSTPEKTEKSPESVKLTPGTPVAQFAEGKNVHECIAAIVRDSEYVKTIAKKLSSPEWQSVVDQFGMVDYFMIKLETQNKEKINPDTKKPYQIFNYVVTPHKVMYTRLPNYGNQKIDQKKLKKLSLRQYNYIYMGKNVDVINFKLNFNTLFFEAIPAALGNSNAQPVPSKLAAGRDKKIDAASRNDNLDNIGNDGLPAVPQMVDSSLTSVDKDSGGQTQADPYAAMAKGIHRAITDSKASMIDGELDILGDPYFLVTGGIGNYNPKPSNETPRMTEDGEAAHNYGEVLITINFRNPTDIDDASGKMLFKSELIPFSGVYRVNEVKSVFQNGQFKQTLKILRSPGQSNVASDPSTKLIPIASPADQPVNDTSPVSDPVVTTDTGAEGLRPDQFTVNDQLGRGYPDPGLPGQPSNYTNSPGGLGGVVNFLNQVNGALTTLGTLPGNLRLADQLFGGSIPGGTSQSAGGIPLRAEAVADLQRSVLSQAALVAQAGNTLQTGFGITDPNTQLANQLVAKSSEIVNQVSVPGSGIGVGATVKFTAADVANGRFNAPGTIVSYGGLSPTAILQASNVRGSAGIVNGVASAVFAATKGTPSDPLAIAAQFGLNGNRLSGLVSVNLRPKVLGQMVDISANIPVNTNLGKASAQGINLRTLTPAGISNLPPTAPYSVAPNARPDVPYLNQVASIGGPSALARSFGTNNVSAIPQSLLSSSVARAAVALSPSVTVNPVRMQQGQVSASVLGGKYLAVGAQVGSVGGTQVSVEAGLNLVKNIYGPTSNGGGNLNVSVTSKFGSISANVSPLSKLMSGE